MSNRKKIKILNMNLLIVLIILILGAVFSINIQAASKSYNVSSNNEQQLDKEVSLPTGALENYQRTDGNGNIFYEFDFKAWDDEWWLLCQQYGTDLQNENMFNSTEDIWGKGKGDAITISRDGNTIINNKYSGEISTGEIDSKTNDSDGWLYSFIVGGETTNEGEAIVSWTEYTKDNSRTDRLTYNTSYVTNPQESYILVNSSTTASGSTSTRHSYVQAAWWKTDLGGKDGGTSSYSSGNLYSMATKFQTYEENIMGVKLSSPENPDDSENWAYYTIDGDKFIAPDIDSKIDVKIEEAEKVEVDIDSKEGEYTVGPFVMDYTGEDSSIYEDYSEYVDALDALLKKINDNGLLESQLRDLKSDPTKEKLETIVNELNGIQDYLFNDGHELETWEAKVTEAINTLSEIYVKWEKVKDNLSSVGFGDAINILQDNRTNIVNALQEKYNYYDGEIKNGNTGKRIDGDFFSITDFTVTTNLGSVTYGNRNKSNQPFNWEFTVNKKTGGKLNDKGFPEAGSEFYIIIKEPSNKKVTEENVVFISNLQATFEYKNAGGCYDSYFGTQHEDTYKENIERNEVPAGYSYTYTARTYYRDGNNGAYYCDKNKDWTISDSNTKLATTDDPDNPDTSSWTDQEVTIYFNEQQNVKYRTEYTHTVTKSSDESEKIQELGTIEKAAMWKTSKTCELNVKEQKYGYIDIKKVTYDAEGNKYKVDEDTEFQFKVYVNYGDGKGYQQLGTDSFTVTVSKDSSSGTYSESNGGPIMITWDDKTPKFYVEEVDPGNDWKDISESDSGHNEDNVKSVKSGETVTVKYENKLTTVHSGHVTITKEVSGDDLGILKNSEFKFLVSLSGNFKYGNNGEYLDRSSANPMVINGEENGLVLQLNETGDGRIKGTWNESERIIERYSSNLGGSYSFTWTSDTIYWYGDAPYCTVREEISDDALYTTENSFQSEYVTCEECEGENNRLSFTFINVPNVKSTSLKIVKKLDSGRDISEGTYRVKVTLKPDEDPYYIINSNGSYEKQTGEKVYNITLNSENEWTGRIDNIFWTGNAPYAYVEEVDTDGLEFSNISALGINVAKSVTNGSDKSEYYFKLDENYETITVNVVNKDETETPLDHWGRLTIQKLAGNDNANILAGEKFNFNVTISGNFSYTLENEDIVYVNGDLIFENGHTTEDNEVNEKYSSDGQTVYSKYYLDGINVKTGKSESTGDFKWDDGEDAPTYTVTENITDKQIASGIKFESLYSETGTSDSNNGKNWLMGSLLDSYETLVICKNGSDKQNATLIVTKKVLYPDGNEEDSEYKTEYSDTFNIKIEIYEDETLETKVLEKSVSLASGQSTKIEYSWSGEKTPYYKITEENATGYTVKYIDNRKGPLENNKTAEVVVENTLDLEKEGNIAIRKDVIVDDKVSDSDQTVNNTIALGLDFEIEVIVSIEGDGIFTYDGDSTHTIYNNNNPLKLTNKIQAGSIWTINGIKWSGDVAPTFCVMETSIPDNYTLDHMDNGAKDDSGSKVGENHDDEWHLKNGKTVGETVVNKYNPDTNIYLTMEMGGKVWNDTTEPDKISSEDGGSEPNGIIDEGEPGIEGVKVTVTRAEVTEEGNFVKNFTGIAIYDVSYTLVTKGTVDDWYIDSKNGNIYTYTNSDGNWSVPRIAVPQIYSGESLKNKNDRVAYYVTFTYDGQTYEPTTFLAPVLVGDEWKNNTAGTTNYSNSESYGTKYTGISNVAKDNFLLSSFAVDDEDDRENFNKKFETISGKEAITETGNTTGTTSGGVTLKYSSTETVSIGNNGNKKLVSELLTDSSSYRETGDDKIYSEFQIDASTINANLAFPTDNDINLSNYDLERQWTNSDGTNRTYHGVYNYINSINLGLVEREAADIAVKNDLEEMIITINGTEVTYKFNSLYDYNEEENWDYLLTQLEMEDLNVTYTLGLYAGDYYYRAASIYGESEAGTELGSYIKSINQNKDLSVLDLNVYLRYKTSVINESKTYNVKVNKLNNYHDKTLKLIDPTEEEVYIKTNDNEEVNNFICLSDIVENNAGNISWSTATNTINGSDGVTYVKETTKSLEGTTIAAGGKIEYETTYKIDTENIADGVALENAIILGEKHNIVEVASFSDYYSKDGRWSQKKENVAGRVDEDSAPDNINLKEFNDTAYYEDDTMQAPMAYVTLSGKDREINGIVWEDARTEELAYSQIVGNGYYNLDEGDKLIEGITTELVEVISVPTDDVDDNGNIIYEEYDFIWPTDETLKGYNDTIENLTGFDSSTETDEMGSYKFVGVPTGDYKVRFVYGDKTVKTGNDGYEVVYNGQDYKSTTYQAGFNNDENGDGYTDNAWHDLSNSELEAARVSDARDSEARRLYIESKSEMQTYSNTSVLALADDTSADYDKLFGNYNEAKEDDPVIGDGYYMYAETAKIKMDVENDNELTSSYISTNSSGYKTYTATEVKGHTTVESYKYEVDNIDFGLEERPQTKLILDKQIKEIKLTTSDEEVILDAIYDIIYNLNSDDTIDVDVKLNETESIGYSNIASLNRNDNNQGYRYLMVDSNILQGATITVDYQLSVFNVGETDTISSRLTEFWKDYNASGNSQEDRNGILENALTELTSPYSTLKNRLTQNKDYNYQYGTYVGSIYYLGKDGRYYYNDNENENYNTDTVYGGSYHTDLVKTTVHNIIDYVDPDVEFINTDNLSKDQSWSTTTIEYLLDNELIDQNNVILINAEGSPEFIDENDFTQGVKTYKTEGGSKDDDESWAIINDNLQEYIVYDETGEDESERNELKNNIALSIDNNDDSDTATNPGLVKGIVPYVAYCNYAAENAYENGEKLEEDVYKADTAEQFAYDRATAVIDLQVSRYYSSETDIEEIDNIAEILKVENTAGRRSTKTIAGNTITYQLAKNEDYEEVNDVLTDTISIYAIALQDADTSATEIITLSPPTGLSSNTMLGIQIAAITLIALSILGIGITFIRKKVLK